jgi:hypothetical protein
MNEKTKKIIFTTLSLIGMFIIFPLSLALFLIDRLILAVLVHIESKNFKAWVENLDNVIQSLYRLIGVATLYGLYKLIVWIF